MPNQFVDPEFTAWVQSLPKTETHLHIEGALEWELGQEEMPELFAEKPPAWDPDFRFKDFTAFNDMLLALAAPFFSSPERYHLQAQRMFQRLQSENIHYVETSFHMGMATFIGCSGEEIVDAIQSAVPAGLEVRVFGGLLRNEEATPGMPAMMEQALSWKGLDGIDMHGHETSPLGDWAAGYWREARAAGKFTKAHAGEFMGASDVERAMDLLGVQRIQHGVGAVRDEALVQRMVKEGVILDMCPVSNVKLRSIKDVGMHPIRTLYDAGICVTLSTDDPMVFGNRLVDDYAYLHRHEGFSKSELIQIVRNGFSVALMDAEKKQGFLDDLDRKAAEVHEAS